MCILCERNEKQEKRPTTFYAWRLVNGKKEDVMKLESQVETKESFKEMLRKANINFDGVDVVR